MTIILYHQIRRNTTNIFYELMSMLSLNAKSRAGNSRTAFGWSPWVQGRNPARFKGICKGEIEIPLAFALLLWGKPKKARPAGQGLCGLPQAKKQTDSQQNPFIKSIFIPTPVRWHQGCDALRLYMHPCRCRPLHLR